MSKTKEVTTKLESRLQYECYSWFWNSYPDQRRMLFHVANELPRYPNENKQEYIIRLSRAKSTGVVPGIPDLVWLRPAKVVAFELKTKYGVVKDSQKKIHALWQERGIDVHVIRDLESFQKVVRSYEQ